jgi:hypothetical protein
MRMSVKCPIFAFGSNAFVLLKRGSHPINNRRRVSNISATANHAPGPMSLEIKPPTFLSFSSSSVVKLSAKTGTARATDVTPANWASGIYG